MIDNVLDRIRKLVSDEKDIYVLLTKSIYKEIISRIIFLSPGWPVHWLARFSHLPFLWWRYWLWLHIPSSRASVCWLRQKIQTGVLHLSSSSSGNSSSRTLQLHSDNSHHLGTLWLFLHGGQWSHLWHLPSQLGHREADLHQPEPTDWSDRVLHHCLTPLWWCTKCRLDWVSGNAFITILIY